MEYQKIWCFVVLVQELLCAVKEVEKGRNVHWNELKAGRPLTVYAEQSNSDNYHL